MTAVMQRIPEQHTDEVVRLRRENAALRRENTALRVRAAVAEHAATHDELTGLPNRAGFHTQARRLIARTPGPVAVAYVDVNQFKSLNDSLGHDVGDLVVRAIGHRLHQTFGELAGRIGGDEFLIVDPLSGSVEDFEARVREASTLDACGEYPEVTAAVGVHVTAGSDEPGVVLARAVVAADAAMYADKRRAR